MKTLNASLLSSGNPSASRFEAASAMFSPEAVGCFGPNGWHDYGMSHGGDLEVAVGDEASFIFTESSPCCSYDHFGHAPYVNLRDAKGNDSICRPARWTNGPANSPERVPT